MERRDRALRLCVLCVRLFCVCASLRTFFVERGTHLKPKRTPNSSPSFSFKFHRRCCVHECDTYV